MAGKPRPLIIETADFRVYLMARMSALKMNVPGLAKELGVTVQAAYQLLGGDLTPSEEIVRKVGLRPAFVADAPGGEPEEAEEHTSKAKSKK